MKETVEKIKQVETRADDMVREAGKEAAEIRAGVDEKEEEFRKQKEAWLIGEVTEFRARQESDRDGRLEEIKGNVGKTVKAVRRQADTRKEKAAESCWEYVKKMITPR